MRLLLAAAAVLCAISSNGSWASDAFAPTAVSFAYKTRHDTTVGANASEAHDPFDEIAQSAAAAASSSLIPEDTYDYAGARFFACRPLSIFFCRGVFPLAGA